MADSTLFVANVSGTVKGGVSMTLAPKTLLVGPTGAGKSRVVNTIELATMGYASDIVGRPEVRSGPDLIALAPEDGPLEARVTLSDGRSAAFRVERKGPGKTSRPAHASPDGVRVVFPATDAVAALRGNVEKARTFVLKHSGLNIDNAAIQERLADHGDWYAADFAGEGEQAPMLRLLAARTLADNERRRVTKQLSLLADAPQGVAKPRAEEIEAAQEAARAAVVRYNEALKIPETLDLNALHGEATGALEALKKQEQRVAQLSAVAETETDTTHEAVKARSALVTLFSLVASYTPEPRNAECILCGSATHVDPADYRQRAEATANANRAAQAVMQAREHLPREQETMARCQARAEKLVHAYREAHAAQTDAAQTDRTARVREAYAAMTAAEGHLHALKAQEREAVNAAAMAEKRAKLKGEKIVWEARYTACADLTGDLVHEARAAFVARVQSYLPETDTFDLVLREHGRDVCLFGFRRDGALHTALSGAEWARLTLALGAVCTPDGGDVLAILAPEERAYDGVTLAAMMRGLSEAPGQVILTSTVKPRGRTPKGWTVIEVGGEG